MLHSVLESCPGSISFDFFCDFILPHQLIRTFINENKENIKDKWVSYGQTLFKYVFHPKVTLNT